MLNHVARLSLLATLLFTAAACTQPAAQVEMKGQNSYNRSNSNAGSYAQSAPVSGAYQNDTSYHTGAAPASRPFSGPTGTVSSARVDSIGVSDLTPPSHNNAGIKVASNNVSSSNSISPFQKAHPETLKPAAGEASNNVNPWTNKPRSVEAVPAHEVAFNLRPQGGPAGKAQMVSDVQAKPSSEKAVSQLDSIIGNDGGTVRKATPAVSKVAKAETPMAGFMWPVSSKKIISQFGPKGNGKANDGINIASAEGEPVWAAADGEVVYVGNELQGYGNMVLIKHNGDKSTTYAHLNRANVEKYDRVKQGDIIGYVGTSGNVREPQLHFAIRDGKDPIDPLKYLKRNVASAQ